MPAYDFEDDMKHRWEEVRPMSEVDEPSTCPMCGRPGRLAFTTAPTVSWFPGTTRPDFKERKAFSG